MFTESHSTSSIDIPIFIAHATVLSSAMFTESHSTSSIDIPIFIAHATVLDCSAMFTESHSTSSIDIPIFIAHATVLDSRQSLILLQVSIFQFLSPTPLYSIPVQYLQNLILL
ncbi:hypothetical protein PoB_004791900 [Plakobranchus ocellatus]|uniref:Uncharacterized protein n=1 Tax=Plakobranchus ocellatus TaxID=259542 RepID=A0AAV4BRE8_9GAST|nr:hypothetical protein PoB_004791900 [Plakobranchus ocellatus]